MTPGVAVAQEEEAAITEARALFMAGDAAAGSERWADAYENFARSYELSGNPIAQFNAAFALRSLGRYREARDGLDKLLREQGESVPDAFRERVEAMRAEVAARLGEVRVQGLTESERYDFRVDGRTYADSGERPLVLDVDSGEHYLVVTAAGGRVFEWSGVVRSGQSADVLVRFPETQADLRVRNLDPDATAGAHDLDSEGLEEDSGGVFESPWFWTGVGVVVAAGATVAAVIVLSGGESLAPESDRVRNL